MFLYCSFCLFLHSFFFLHHQRKVLESFSVASCVALLRVILSAQDIRKLRLDSVPDSVDGLKLVLKNKLQLRSSFDLQYEHEDFKDFCNLTCVDDLPKDKVTLQVIFCLFRLKFGYF